MGCKLNGFEGAGLFSPQADAGRWDRTGLSRSNDLQYRIAQQLGISIPELKNPGEIPDAVQNTNNLVRSTDTSLSRECLELIDAYMRITDPEQRLRCLLAVRDAADAGSATEP